MNLEELGRKHDTDKLWHGYLPHYERHFSDLRDEPLMLLEVGVASGASMRMWDEWFTHKHAVLVGMDIEPETPTDFGDRVQIVISDVNDYEFEHTDYFDAIIDDASHTSEDIVNTLWRNWKHLRHGGWYVIEDLAVQWRNDYGGGGKGSEATEMIKEFFDQLWKKDHQMVDEIHVYDEIVFLRKAQ